MNRNRIIVVLLFLVGIIGFVNQVQADDIYIDSNAWCGVTLADEGDTYILTTDLICTGHGLIVGANSITIDGNGHTITGDGGTSDYGINNSDEYDTITIQNFGNITNFGGGIYLSSSTNSTIQNNTTNSNGYGIYLLNSSGESADKNWWSVASDSDGSNLIAGADGNLYTSDNYGETWTERKPAGDVIRSWQIVASDSDGSNLIAGNAEGQLYTSNDSGQSWAERLSVGEWRAVASDSNGLNLIAATYGDNGRIYTSHDSGQTWTEQRPAGDVDKNWKTVDSDCDGSHVVAAVFGGRIYTGISADGGATYSWIEQQPAGDVSQFWGSVAFDSDGSHLIAGAVSGRLYIGVSIYGGVTYAWSEKYPPGGVYVDDSWQHVASDSDGSNLIATNDRIYTSDNYGTTWIEQRPAGDVDAQWLSSDSDSDGSRLIAAVLGGRIYTSSNFGLTWIWDPFGTMNVLNNNIANSNFNAGIFLNFSNFNILTNNTTNSNSGSTFEQGLNQVHAIGIYLNNSSNNYLGLNSIPGTGNMANSNSNTGIYIYGGFGNYLNYNITNSNGIWGILTYQSDNSTFADNNASLNGSYGIQLDAGSASSVNKNTANSNGMDGIYFYTNSFSLIENNIVQNNSYTGIRIRGGSFNNRVTKNTIKSNLYGIYLADNSSNFLTNNIIDSNTSDGVYLDASTSSLITSNTFYNTLPQFALKQINNSTGTLFKNNIVYSGKYISVENGSQTGCEYDYNNYYGGSGNYFNWLGTDYSTFADWRTNSGQDANSLNSDPLLTDTAGDDFSLKSNSPCIDAGTDVDTPDIDYMSLERYDYPFINNTGGGTITYYDIGAYEYVGINFGTTNTMGSDHSIGYSIYPTTIATAVPLAVIPSAGTVDIIVSIWGDYYKEWTETASAPGITAEHIVGDLVPDNYYEVRKNGVSLGLYLSDATGKITFTCEAGSTFTIMRMTIIDQTDSEDNNDDDEYQCFLTKLFATARADENSVLCTIRDFRDSYLLTNPIGEVFVSAYYKVSPNMAEFIKRHAILKKFLRTTLKPLIWITEKSVE